MNAKELPTAHERNTYRAIKNGDLSAAATLDALGATHTTNWCDTHNKPAADCVTFAEPTCKPIRLYRVPKA